ncbi:MAG: hypothetical protein ACI9R3_004989 [Verrucomicrobiales bacterium]
MDTNLPISDIGTATAQEKMSLTGDSPRDGQPNQNSNTKIERLKTMASEPLTRDEIEEIVIENATKYPKYREALLTDPKKIVETQLNNTLPDNVTVEIVQESAGKIYIRLPHLIADGSELSDEDLEQVAGGKDDTYSCNESIGGFNTRNEFSASVY